jgi:hypothetical protein
MNISLMEALLRERQSDAYRHLAAGVRARKARRASEIAYDEAMVAGSCLEVNLASTPVVTSCPELQLLVARPAGRAPLLDNVSMPEAS